MKNTLMLSTFIPHYREGLIQLLAEECNLTATSVDLKKLNLIPPNNSNKNYNLVKTKAIGLIEKVFNISIIPKEIKLATTKKWDVIFSFYSLRYPHRFFIFFIYKIFKPKVKWVWLGHIYGRRQNFITKKIMNLFINNSNGVITYTNEYAEKLKNDGIKVNVDSWNNTSVFAREIQPLNIKEKKLGKLNLIFVGRFQKRKKLERLLTLADRRNDINIRLIGPGMEQVIPEINKLGVSEIVKVFPPLTGDKLKEHFEWAHIVVNPGHVGLLVVTAGQYGRPIIIDSKSEHAPEYIIAQKTEQYFIDWTDNKEVDKMLNSFKNNPLQIEKKGFKLSSLILKEYTFEKSLLAFKKYLN